MKKVNKMKSNGQVVTKTYLDNKLDPIIKKLEEHDKKFENIDKRFIAMKDYLDFRLQPLEGLTEFKESVLKTLDWLVNAFKKFNEEHTILTGQYSGINEKVDSHEQRITVLEKKTTYH